MAGAVDVEKSESTQPQAVDAAVAEQQPPQVQPGREIAAAGAADAKAAAVAGADAELSQECLIKHPLHSQWTLWYLHNDRQKSWEDMQNRITAFETVEDFWSLYNHIRVASEIGGGNDYSLFKRNIRPMWEDKQNKSGGRWLIQLQRQHTGMVDQLWLDTLLCLIGEAFDNSEDICGAVVNIRPRGHKIAVWTADGKNRNSILSIGHKLKEALGLPNDMQMIYELHTASANKGAKPLYTI